jgi:hypothetical protein
MRRRCRPGRPGGSVDVVSPALGRYTPPSSLPLLLQEPAQPAHRAGAAGGGVQAPFGPVQARAAVPLLRRWCVGGGGRSLQGGAPCGAQGPSRRTATRCRALIPGPCPPPCTRSQRRGEEGHGQPQDCARPVQQEQRAVHPVSACAMHPCRLCASEAAVQAPMLLTPACPLNTAAALLLTPAGSSPSPPPPGIVRSFPRRRSTTSS